MVPFFFFIYIISLCFDLLRFFSLSPPPTLLSNCWTCFFSLSLSSCVLLFCLLWWLSILASLQQRKNSNTNKLFCYQYASLFLVCIFQKRTRTHKKWDSHGQFCKPSESMTEMERVKKKSFFFFVCFFYFDRDLFHENFGNYSDWTTGTGNEELYRRKEIERYIIALVLCLGRGSIYTSLTTQLINK